MYRILLLPALLICFSAIAQDPIPPEATELYKPVPVVTPGTNGGPPSDAIFLFDGKGLDQFKKASFNSPEAMVTTDKYKGFDQIIPNFKGDEETEPAKWKIENGELVVVDGAGNIMTKQAFGDIQLHVEWMAPKPPANRKGQDGGNSGIIFMGFYEVQVLNSFENPTYSNGQATAVYKQHIPRANATRPPGQWQTYDIIFMAPKFSENGTVVSPARVTVFHNGILTQNNVELLGPTCYRGTPYYIPHPEKLPLVLQDHSDPIRYRNIWVREL